MWRTYIEKQTTKQEIRKIIMNQSKPFCLIDLYRRIESAKPANRGLILEVLDELYMEGLVEYAQLAQKMGNTEWAFVVDNDIMDLNKVTKGR